MVICWCCLGVGCCLSTASNCSVSVPFVHTLDTIRCDMRCMQSNAITFKSLTPINNVFEVRRRNRNHTKRILIIVADKMHLKIDTITDATYAFRFSVCPSAGRVNWIFFIFLCVKVESNVIYLNLCHFYRSLGCECTWDTVSTIEAHQFGRSEKKRHIIHMETVDELQWPTQRNRQRLLTGERFTRTETPYQRPNKLNSCELNEHQSDIERDRVRKKRINESHQMTAAITQSKKMTTWLFVLLLFLFRFCFY